MGIYRPRATRATSRSMIYLRQRKSGERMKAFIYTGGEVVIDNVCERPEKEDLVISADAGYLLAKRFGVVPNIAVGDFDTFGEYDFEVETRVIRLPSEKDMSDTEAAIDIALDKGACEIIIVGGLDGRLDHTLANLRAVEDLTRRGVRAYITDGRNRVRYLFNSSDIIAKAGFKYLSLVCLGKKARGVTLKGVKYPLDGATLLREKPSYSISNEIVESCALVALRRGAVMVIESNDK